MRRILHLLLKTGDPAIRTSNIDTVAEKRYGAAQAMVLSFALSLAKMRLQARKHRGNSMRHYLYAVTDSSWRYPMARIAMSKNSSSALADPIIVGCRLCYMLSGGVSFR